MVFSIMLVKGKESRDRVPLVGKAEQNMHAHDMEDDEEETLSFCEFSLNSDADVWEDSSSSRDSQNSSFKSSEGDEYFEFSQELSTTSTMSNPPESIIFCGKLISNKQPTSENTKKMEKIKPRKHKKRRFFRWKWNFGSSHKTKISRKNASKSTCAKGSRMQKQEKKSSQIISGSNKTLAAPETPEERCTTRRKRSKQHDLKVHKTSFFTSTGKSRWYLFLFGITKFRTEMELRDMKNRQNRRRSSSFSLFRMENDEDNNNSNKSACMNRSRGFWVVLRALSCGGELLSTAVVKASSGDIAQV